MAETLTGERVRQIQDRAEAVAENARHGGMSASQEHDLAAVDVPWLIAEVGRLRAACEDKQRHMDAYARSASDADAERDAVQLECGDLKAAIERLRGRLRTRTDENRIEDL